MDALTIRPADPSEIDEMVGIDDDATSIFAGVGLSFDHFRPDHPFVLAEHGRWLAAAREGFAYLARDGSGRAIGLLVMGRVGGLAYLEQLSVRAGAMRRGVGTRLLRRAFEWAGTEDLWLTTYAHVPWNGPYYERAGFRCVPEAAVPPALVDILEEQRRWLPEPSQRVAMVAAAQGYPLSFDGVSVRPA